ncbi:MAG: hypothetical protein D6796_00575 [Caldilineae bacterium]|nr:MAG: hypothetical protein D6796_00575 [Caldilineae bacterium]
MLRGGAWVGNGDVLRAAYRVTDNPNVSRNLNGFRCARSP